MNKAGPNEDGPAQAPASLIEVAQIQIAPKLPSAGGSVIAPQLPSTGGSSGGITPQLPSAGGSSSGISPQLPSAGGSSSGIAPQLPGSGVPTPPAPAAPAPSHKSGAGLNITITNPENLPRLAPGQNELKLIIASPEAVAPAPPPKVEGLGFWEVFLALVAALVIAPYVQKEAGKWFASVNAIDFVKKNGIVISGYLIFFSAGWMVFMIVLPQLYMLDFSFRFNLPPADYGGPDDVYTLKNYEYLLFGRKGDEDLFNWLHLAVFTKTIFASVIVTVIDFALCYPIAYFMAQSVAGKHQRLLFLCLLMPFWVNEILRAFAFKLIFAQQGILNVAMMGLGLWDTPFDFFKADVALFTGLTYAYILLMIFPLYNAIESLDHNQIEAARDLGASWFRIHLRVVMPYAKPGIASGCTMVFMLSAGALAAPNILGGPSSLWFTQIIYQWYNTGGNWPQGSAYAFVLLIACIIFVRIMMRVFKVGLGEIAGR